MNEDMLIAITEAYYLKLSRSARLSVPCIGPNMENSSTLTISNASTASSGSADKTKTDHTEKEKEKKRKGLSASRLKKFYRHFQQLSTDEQVINCECYINHITKSETECPPPPTISQPFPLFCFLQIFRVR